MRESVRRSFRSLQRRNFRLYFAGQFISSVGLWMQQVAELWLILELTDSAAALGAITVTHFGPILLFGLWGGVVADRADKRRLLLVTQSLLGAVAVALAVFSALDGVTTWLLYGFSLATGLVLAVDNPTRRAFVREMVPLEDVPNAVSLNSMLMTSARIVGPALSGLLIAGSGATIVFVINGVSYYAVVIALAFMRVGDLYRAPPVARGRGQLAEGLRYAWRTAGVRLPIVMLAWIGTLSFNLSLLLALFAEQVFAQGSGGFGALISLSAIGSMLGALVTATRERASLNYNIVAAIAFGVVTIVASFAPTFLSLAFLLIPVGIFGIAFLAGTQSVTQSAARPQMQGRVMALYSVVFLGSTPIGGVVAGTMAELLGPRVAFAFGGVVALFTGLWAWRVTTRSDIDITPFSAEHGS